MIGKRKIVEVYRQTKALLASGQTVVDIPADNMPAGIIHGFHVRFECSALTGLGAAAADFQKVLNGITYGSQNPKHNVMTAFPGKFWDRIWTAIQRRALDRTTPTTGGFAISYYLPHSWPSADRFKAFRDKDTALLNINNKALPFLTLLLGPYSDLGTTISVAPNVVIIVEAEYEPVVRAGFDNPVDPRLSGDQPIRRLSITAGQKADLSTTPILNLNTGDVRENIGFVARELDNTGTEVSDIFNVGVNTPSKIEVVVGDSDVYTPRRKIKAHDADMDRKLGAAIPAGYHFWFADDQGKLTDAVDLRAGPKFQVLFDNLVTTANRVLEVAQIDTLDLTKEHLALHNQWLGVTPAP